MTQVAKPLAAAAIIGLFSSMTAVAGEAGRTTVNCFGGVTEAFKIVTRNAAVGYSSIVFITMPDTLISGGVSGLAGDADTYTVTWSGQSSNTTGAWQAQAQASVNGGAFFDIDPIGPNIMHGGATTQTNTMTWCIRMQATVSAVFQIRFARFNGGTVTLDNYVTRVERSN